MLSARGCDVCLRRRRNGHERDAPSQRQNNLFRRIPQGKVEDSERVPIHRHSTGNLHGNAEAEQYVFARSGRDNILQRFYLIQFEHFLPTNNLTYDYASMRTTQINSLKFNYDVKSFPNLGALLMEDQGSDGAAMEQLLAKQHLLLPHNTAWVRMFHLPSADHRTELMIIYGEALPQNTAVPVREGGVQLDTESPDSAQMFLEHARQGLVVQTR